MIVAIRVNLLVKIRQQFCTIARHKADARDLALLQHLMRKQRVAQGICVPGDDFIPQQFRA